jgi:hypothetical protein
MFLLESIGGYEQKYARLFQTANYGNLTLVSSDSDYFITNAAGIPSESFTDPACGDCSFDISKEEAIVCHLFKEVWDREFVFALPHSFSNEIDDSQSSCSSQAVW